MSKELTPLEIYNELLDIIDVPVKSHLLNFNDKSTLERYRLLRTQIETALKALEIIKKKNIDIAQFKCYKSLTDYNQNASPLRWLTQEEYELLKKVLL